jgi:hypothetical protein
LPQAAVPLVEWEAGHKEDVRFHRNSDTEPFPIRCTTRIEPIELVLDHLARAEWVVVR